MTASDPPIETLVTGYGLVEGPRVDANGRLFFSDARGGGVYCRSPGGEIETVVPKRRGVGGIAIHASGGIVVSGKNLCHVKDGESRILFDREDALGFNDLFTDAEGRVLVGSQRFSPFDPKANPEPGELYRVSAGARGEVLYGDVMLTNGIGFSPEGHRLYHSDTLRNQVLVHDVAEDGSVSKRRVFASLSKGRPDGLAVDEAGGVWVAAFGGGCVTRLAPTGEVDRQIEVPAKGVASLCFGCGAEGRDLYITSSDNTRDPTLGGSIFRTRVDVAGLAAPLATI